MEGKRVQDSYTSQVEIVMPQHINSQGRLFGGQLAQWIDVVANVVSRRHSGRLTSTLRIDELIFRQPVYVASVVLLEGQVCYVGNTSMIVRVLAQIETPEGKRTLAADAYVTLIALDEEQKPTSVPQLVLETEAEKAAWLAAGELYKRHRLERA